MPRLLAAILVILGLFLVVGILIPGIYRARAEQDIRRCQNNLRQIGTYGLFHSGPPNQPLPLKPENFFPPGTLVNLKLPPEQRMSWYVLVLPAVEQGPEPGGAAKKAHPVAEMLAKIDVDQPWDAEAQQAAAQTRIAVLICPARAPGDNEPQAITTYVGNGGLGLDTPTLPLEKAGTKAGLFRYDTPTPIEVVRDADGLSNSLSILETGRSLGPWLRGGPSTVRGLDVDALPYLGANAPFSGNHQGRGNFALADGSVRVLTDTVSPAIFRALLTIQGNETINDLSEL